MASPSDNVVRILVELDSGKTHSEFLKLEQDIKRVVGEMFGPSGASVGIWKDMQGQVEPLIASLKNLKKEYADLIPKIKAAEQAYEQIGGSAIRSAAQFERYKASLDRSALANERLRTAQARRASAEANALKASSQATAAEARKELALRRTELATTRNQLAVLKLEAQIAAFAAGKAKEQAVLLRNENLMLRNAIMAQRLAKGYYTAGSSVASFASRGRGAFGGLFSSITRLAAGLGIIISSGYALRAVYRQVFETFKLGIETMDTIRLKSASMAGAMLIAAPSMDFSQALGQADQLLLKSFTLSREFVGSARELQVLMEAMATFGVKIDLTTQQGRKSFVSFANTLKLVTQGQNFEIQAFQEIRALMQGQNFQGAMLARRMQALGIDVKKMVPIWTEQGVLLDKIVEAMGGYAQATSAIENTLYSQRKLTESIVALIMKEGLSQAYEEIKATLIAINWALLGNEELTARSGEFVSKIKNLWIDVRNYILDILPHIVAFARFTGMVADGLRASLDLLKEILGYVAGPFKWVWNNLVPTGFRKDIEDAFRLNWDELTAGGEEAANRLRDMFGEMQRDSQAQIAQSAEFYKDAFGNLQVRYIKPPAKSPPAEKTAMETEALNFAQKLKTHLEKAERDSAVAYNKWGDSLVTSIVKARNKVRDEYAKFFDNKYWDAIVKKMPDLAQKVKEQFDIDLTDAGLDVLNKWYDDVTEVFTDFNQSLNSIFAGHLEEYDGLDEGLQKKMRKIDKTMDDLKYKIFDKFTEMTRGLTEGPEAEFAGDLLQQLMDNLERLREQMKEKTQTEWAKEQAEQAKNLREELQAIIDTANIPVKWPWNENEIELAEQLAQNTKKVADARVKLGKALFKGQISWDDYTELMEKTTEALEAMNEKTREETNETTKIVAAAWTETFDGLGNLTKSFFSDLMHGELKNAQDYFQSFVDMVIQMWSNMIGNLIQKWLEAELGNMMTDTLSGFGGFLSGLFGGGLSSSGLPGGLGIGAGEGLGMGFITKEGGVLPSTFQPIKAFAGGGIIDRPTLGWVGEGGGPEAVIPLKGGKVPVSIRGGEAVRQEVSVNFQIMANDTRDFDRLLYQRRNMITGMIQHAIREAHPTRDVIRRYGR